MHLLEACLFAAAIWEKKIYGYIAGEMVDLEFLPVHRVLVTHVNFLKSREDVNVFNTNAVPPESVELPMPTIPYFSNMFIEPL